MDQEIINSIYNLLPELTLALAIIILPLLQKSGSKLNLNLPISLAALFIAFIFVWAEIYSPPKIVFQGLLVIDPFSSFAKLAVLFFSTMIALIFFRKGEKNSLQLILLVTLGALASVSSSSLVMSFISLEVISIAVCLMISGNRALSFKYFTYAAVSSGLMLYGISLMYGLTGSADYYEISKVLSASSVNELTLTISVILIFCGFGFKMFLFPLNFIFPSLAEKISLNELALISAVPLISAAVAAARFFLTAFHDSNAFIIDESAYRIIQDVKWQNLTVIVSTASIIAGNLIVLWQQNLKKIFSCMLIGQAGYLLLPLVMPSYGSSSALIVNMFAFCLAAVGSLICLKLIAGRSNNNENITIADLKGFGKSSPLVMISLIVFLISFAGLPFTPAYSARAFMYAQIFSGPFYWFAIIMLLSTAGYIYFMVKLTITSFTGITSNKSASSETFHTVLLLSFLLSNCLFGLYPHPILNLGRYCSKIIGI